MPRRPNFKPFKRGGGWHVYSPLDGGVTDLKTDREDIARSKADALHRHYKAEEAKTGKMPKTKAEAPKSRATAPKQPSAQSMVSSWLQSSPSSSPVSSHSDPELVSPSVSSLPATPEQSISPVQQSPAVSGGSTTSRVDALMPDERRRRLADLCARGAANISVLLVGAGVRVFGRIPNPDVDPEEKKVLEEGLSLWMEEIFVDHPPRPWMVVGGAAVGIGIGMYVDGTPIKREPTIKPPENYDGPYAVGQGDGGR